MKREKEAHSLVDMNVLDASEMRPGRRFQVTLSPTDCWMHPTDPEASDGPGQLPCAAPAALGEYADPEVLLGSRSAVHLHTVCGVDGQEAGPRVPKPFFELSSASRLLASRRDQGYSSS